MQFPVSGSILVSRRSAKDMCPFVKQWLETRENQKDFCSFHRPQLAVFSYWLKKLRLPSMLLGHPPFHFHRNKIDGKGISISGYSSPQVCSTMMVFVWPLIWVSNMDSRSLDSERCPKQDDFVASFLSRNFPNHREPPKILDHPCFSYQAEMPLWKEICYMLSGSWLLELFSHLLIGEYSPSVFHQLS